MEDLFKCPICCNETFDSKESLLQHISDILENLYCPVCKNKWSTLEHLIKHLTLDNCQKEEASTIIIQNELQHTIHVENNNEITGDKVDITSNKDEIIESMNKSNGEQFGSVYTPNTSMVTSEDSKMYVELLSKQLTKPCLQKQELKLVNEDGENHYVIISQPSSELNEFTVVTKQNNDGTISLTTVNDVKLENESGALMTPIENEVDNSQEEMYTCNTCDISFSSVIEHIQNYHNNQIVVVEDENDPESDLSKNEDIDVTFEKQMPRRVITETGDIVEAPVRDDISDVVQEPKDSGITTKSARDPLSCVTTTRYVQLENFCESVVKDIKSAKSIDNLAYHKVVVKKIKVQNGSSVNMYHCKSCEIYAASLEDLRVRPCKSPIYACPLCNAVFDNSKLLCVHMKQLHKDPDTIPPAVPVSYECELCSTVFPSNKSLKLHKRMHDPLKFRPIEPPVENKDGSEVSNNIYRCQICDKIIPIDYKVVHQNSHNTTNRFHCAVCNKKFTSNEYLKMHMSVHNVDKVTVNDQDKSLPYNCSYCTKRFARPHEKVKHERIHTGEKPHTCDICGKSFRVSYCLTLHMRTHTGARPYACTFCGKRFKAHSVYNHHLLTHSDVRAYKCPYCPKAFKTSVQLAGHKNSHTKPFSCLHCNRPFASLYAVRVHTETHARQNNLKFSCSLCGASYARTFALKDHIRQAHSSLESGMSSNELIVP